MKVLVHVLAVNTPDSEAVSVTAHPSKFEAAASLMENYADDDQEFLDYLVAMDPFVMKQPLHQMPLDQLIKRVEDFYNLDITHDIQEIEVALPKADPTPLMEYVAKATHERYLSEPHLPEALNKPWDDLSMDVKRKVKQGVAQDVYFVLHGLTAQGTIGGIVNG